MKKIFINELIKATRKNKNTCLIVNDLGFGMIEPFKKNFHKMFLTQEFLTKHDGLWRLIISWKTCFVYSIANFNTFRCAEQ